MPRKEIFLCTAIIFDMDGVVVDSEPLHIRAEKKSFVPYGIHLTDRDLQGYMGRSSRIFLQDMIKKYNLNTTIHEMYPEHKRHLLQLYREEITPIPGVLSLMNILKKEGLDMALASSSDRDLIDVVVEKLHLSEFLKTSVSGEEVKRTKPSPDIFLETARRLHCAPHTCVVIEDSAAGIEAALSAGMASVGFRSPHSLNQDLKEAHLVVDDLQKINVQQLIRLAEESH